jgi:hypothetical protein
VEWLNVQALSSNPSTTKKKKKTPTQKIFFKCGGRFRTFTVGLWLLLLHTVFSAFICDVPCESWVLFHD